MAYPRDIAVGEDYDIQLGADNDLRPTRGFQNVEQHAALDVSGEIRDVLGGPINGTSVAKLEQSVTRTLESREFVEEVIRVEVIEVDKESREVSLDVVFVDDDGYQISGITLPSTESPASTSDQLCIQNGETRVYDSPLVITDFFCINSGGEAVVQD